MQMADENLKLKKVLLEMKAFSGAEISTLTSMSHHVPLAKKYENMLTKLGEQHRKFMDELGQVKLICVHLLREFCIIQQEHDHWINEIEGWDKITTMRFLNRDGETNVPKITLKFEISSSFYFYGLVVIKLSTLRHLCKARF